MKRHLIGCLAALLLLTGCAAEEETFGSMSREGIAPCALTQPQQQVLQAIGMEDTAKLFSFLAPEEAITMEIRAYRLTDGDIWTSVGDGSVSIGTEREPISRLAGTIGMTLEDRYRIAFHLNVAGQSAFSTEEIQWDEAPSGSCRAYLTELQEITLHEEIPIAVLVYDDGTAMKAYTVEDYFEPSAFDGMDLVQAVTVEFSDQILEA